MCDQMAAKVHHNALYDESWKKLRATCGERAIEMADLFLRLVRPSIDGRTPEFYNVNAHLGETINEAVVVAGSVERGGAGLDEVLSSWSAQEHERKDLHMLLRANQLDLTKRQLDLNAAYGFAALIFLSDSLEELILTDNPLGDDGVTAIAMALAAKPRSRLHTLTLNLTNAGEHSVHALETVIETASNLSKLDLRQNFRGSDQQRALQGRPSIKDALEHAKRRRLPNAAKLLLVQ